MNLNSNNLTINISSLIPQISENNSLKLDVFQVFLENGQFKKHLTLDIKYVPFSSMKNELELYASILDKSKTKEELFNDLYTFVLDVYGNVSKTVLKSNLEKSGIL
jgi:predicted ATP-dependent endonuclease of OLD family